MNAKSTLRLTIGPLRYQFRSHDEWGREALGKLRAHVECVSFRGRPGRTIHLVEFDEDAIEYQREYRERLPHRLQALLPSGSPLQGWHLNGDETGHLVWWHDGTRETLWTFGSLPFEHRAVFQIPWPVLVQDMIALGGAIMHGGLVAYDGKGYLFTAPPGGGKTTALSRIPAPWQVLADDAALIWPTRKGEYLASPLPTWSVLLGYSEIAPTIRRWQVATVLSAAGIIVLQKAKNEMLHALSPIEAAPLAYRALSEHPRIADTRHLVRPELFRIACALARSVPASSLKLTRTGPFWDALDVSVLNHPRQPNG